MYLHEKYFNLQHFILGNCWMKSTSSSEVKMLKTLLHNPGPCEKGCLQCWTQHWSLLVWWGWELRHLRFFL